MANRLTPIERAIAGQPDDRRRRYDDRLRDQGLAYVRVLVRADQADQVREFARQLRDQEPVE